MNTGINATTETARKIPIKPTMTFFYVIFFITFNNFYYRLKFLCICKYQDSFLYKGFRYRFFPIHKIIRDLEEKKCHNKACLFDYIFPG